MKRAWRWGIAAFVGALPIVPLASSSCTTELSYRYVEPDAAPETSLVRPPKETPDPCGLVVTPSIVDYGALLLNKQLSRTISIKNLQNTRRSVDVLSSDAPHFAPNPSRFEIGPSETITIAVNGVLDTAGQVTPTPTLTLVSGPAGATDAGDHEGGDPEAGANADAGATCSTVVQLRAVGIGRGRQVGPQPLDFGPVVCNGTPAAAQQLVITSVNADPGDYTAAVPSPFVIAKPTGSVAADGNLPIDVTAGPIGPAAGVLSRSLSLTISNAKGGAPFVSTIEVKATAVGANVVVTPNVLLFIDKSPQQADIENTGNKRVEIELTAAGGYKVQSVATGGTTIALEPFGFAGSTGKIKITPVTAGDPPPNVSVTPIERAGILCVFGGLVLKYSTMK